MRDGTIKTLRPRFAFIEPRDKSSKDVYAPYESWSHLVQEKGFQKSARVSFESKLNEKGEQIAYRVSLLDQRIPKKVNTAALRSMAASGDEKDDDFENESVAPSELKRALNAQKFPPGLARALGPSATLRYKRRIFVVDGSPENASKVREILNKRHYPGFVEWMAGGCGWRVECAQRLQIRVVTLLERIQKCYKKEMKKLLLKKKEARELFYEHGHDSSCAKKTEVWTLGSKDNLKSYVERTRSFLEVILYYKMDRKWSKTEWLEEESWNAICQQALKLMRGADHGPDVPVQWASHQPRNHYPLSVVTEASLSELVVGLAKILSHMFRLRASMPVGSSLSSVQEFLDSVPDDDDDDDLGLKNLSIR